MLHVKISRCRSPWAPMTAFRHGLTGQSPAWLVGEGMWHPAIVLLRLLVIVDPIPLVAFAATHHPHGGAAWTRCFL